MTNFKSIGVRGLLLPMAAALLPISCQSVFPAQKGNLVVSISCDPPVGASTKALDSDDFILKVTDSKGNVIYSGTYGASPESIIVSPGTYTVQCWSCEFSAPLFDAPQYGDTEVVVIKEGDSRNVTMYCSQLNAGIKLNVHPDFLTDYPNGVLFLKSSEGRLMYSYNERRIAYFLPGAVSLTLSDKGTETTLFTRNLSAKQVLSVNLSVAGQSSGQDGVKSGISIQLDTARNWVSEDCVIGGEDSGPDGTEVENAMTVAQAKNAAGSQDVWVEGYIVGGDLSSSRCSFLPPFTSRTNLVIASRSSCTDREQCLSVQLAKGSVRDALNLVDHEDYLGRKIWLKGDIVQEYYGIVGIQCITEYRLK